MCPVFLQSLYFEVFTVTEQCYEYYSAQRWWWTVECVVRAKTRISFPLVMHHRSLTDCKQCPKHSGRAPESQNLSKSQLQWESSSVQHHWHQEMRLGKSWSSHEPQVLIWSALLLRFPRDSGCHLQAQRMIKSPQDVRRGVGWGGFPPRAPPHNLHLGSRCRTHVCAGIIS